MKYNDKLVIRENDSHSMILSQIRRNSSVLEFGSANGMMTKYMKEELGCQVYIVEYEKPAYEEAIQYADGGSCSDIMEMEWYDQFQLQFDYILFADVLEHLSTPKLILQKAKDKLKDDGEVLISIPNIAHNDIVLKLMGNNFDYTLIGLLDDTHVHFFAMNNIEEFVHGAGYEVTNLEYVTKPTFQTEQFCGNKIPLDSYMENMLFAREYGEVYQFVIKLQKKEAVGGQEISNVFCRKAEPICGKLYYDRGKGYTEDDMVSVEAEHVSDRKYRCVYQVDDLKGVKGIRYDPIEGQGCMITKCRIEQGDVQLDAIYSSSLQAGENLLLFDKDPMVCVLVSDQEQSIRMEVEFSILGQEYLEELTINCSEAYKNMGVLQEKNETDIRKIEEQNEEIQNLNEQLQQWQKKLGEKDIELMQNRQKYEDNLESKEKIIHMLSANIYDNIVILQEKIEMDIQIKNRKIEEQNEHILKQKKEIEELNIEVSQAKAAYEHIIQTKSWKLTRIFRKIGSIWKRNK